MFRPTAMIRGVVHVVDSKADNESHVILAGGLAGTYHVITETNRAGEVTVVVEVMTLDQILANFDVKTYGLVKDNLGAGNGQWQRVLGRRA